MKTTRYFLLLVSTAMALSLTGCFPKPPIGMPDVSVIGVENGQAVAPDCTALEQESLLMDGGFDKRPSMAWGCATYSNLAAQLANPNDLVAPQKTGPADGAVAAAAMRRYQSGQVIQLDKSTTQNAIQ